VVSQCGLIRILEKNIAKTQIVPQKESLRVTLSFSISQWFLENNLNERFKSYMNPYSTVIQKRRKI
jgi:hypothetical protein